MNRIHLLSEHVANQIAAGEVVERPASVVKELVENSLDAGATRLSVEIQGAGRGLIRIVDDGIGMSRDDALLCLERHATSKIAAAADLARITTMGFRGEAVPSIASVSRFVLTTKERDAAPEAPATQVIIHGGRIQEVKEAGASPGTSIEVRSLFFNVPARRKFLRSDETERAHIQHWLTTAALAHPHVGFHFVLEGRTVWQLPALPRDDSTAGRLHALKERLRLLVGDGLAWVPVDAAGTLEATPIAPADTADAGETSPPTSVTLWGWIGAPGVARASRDDQHVFVNRRPIDNRGLNHALLEGYHNALMKGRYPLCCLFLELDPAEVDVNIHPAKREVKFHRERAVRRFVAEAIREALKSWHSASVTATTGASTTPATFNPPSARALPPEPSRPAATQVEWTQWRPPTPRPEATSSPSPPTPASPRRPSPTPAADDSGSTATPAAAPASTPIPEDPPTLSTSPPPPAAAPTAPSRFTSSPSTEPVPLLSVPLRLVGVIGRLYVVLESDRGLVLLDQHAAHERVLYEQMLRRTQQETPAPSQRLLLPETLELSPKDAVFLRENLEALTHLGVGLSEFGERTFLLDALPPFVKSTSPRRFALELVDELRAAVGSLNSWRLGENVVAKTVCRHAVKANDPLAGPELESLIEDLRRCEMPYTCPHGRPTIIEMNFRELEKRFGRIQG